MAWSADSPNRIRGRAGVAQRKRRKTLYPLCAHCQERGIVRATDEIDHIVPLAHGGEDTDDNCQGLCSDCHAIKTASEDASHGGAANHPDWLERSAIPIVIVCGPPCSGKTTYVKQHSSCGDIVIDLDEVMARVSPGYRQWQGNTEAGLLNKAIRMRNAMLGSLARQKDGRAWFIVSAPSKAERDWWQRKLGGEVVLLHPGADECKSRALARGTPRAVQGVDLWERASRQTWLAPKARRERQTFGTDGWPV